MVRRRAEAIVVDPVGFSVPISTSLTIIIHPWLDQHPIDGFHPRPQIVCTRYASRTGWQQQSVANHGSGDAATNHAQ